MRPYIFYYGPSRLFHLMSFLREFILRPHVLIAIGPNLSTLLINVPYQSVFSSSISVAVFLVVTHAQDRWVC